MRSLQDIVGFQDTLALTSFRGTSKNQKAPQRTTGNTIEPSGDQKDGPYISAGITRTQKYVMLEPMQALIDE